MEKRALAIIGAGGFGREAAEYARDINRVKPTWNRIGFIDDNSDLSGRIIEGVPVWGTTETIDEQIKEYLGIVLNDGDGNEYLIKRNDIDIVCAIGNPKIKKKAIYSFQHMGFRFVNVIHPTAYLGRNITLGHGIIIGPYSVITTNVRLENHVSINPQCGVGHDCIIGGYTSLYWNVNISGNVEIGKACELGTKSTILQGLSIGSECVVGANAVVTKSIPSNLVVVGVPAKPI
ncbi:hypothetical protein BHU72_05365 [Desulfuribacillus stibiiarsenatis]|uniref:PglD N-terminal domain-containing protein n=1 Tax=Desulfuribacillus stibiiarsenatis TaxID=1390249 RepID=A0A1E5L5V8_9FIRM|nr:acetyltransferase [Desulfuribacillus stibiiarsenatis]OEH85515.1 hypothetical protein BHU72_05365 [Desulfuribacillus stibiiarsenatis]